MPPQSGRFLADQRKFNKNARQIAPICDARASFWISA
jgi:hypothetical protein